MTAVPGPQEAAEVGRPDWAVLSRMAQYDIGRGHTPYPHCNHRRQIPVRPGVTQCKVCALLTVVPLVPAQVSR